MENQNRTTLNGGHMKTLSTLNLIGTLKEPEKYADFYRSTIEVLREDMEKEFDDVVTYSIIFLELKDKDQKKWVDQMRNKWLAAMEKVDASLLERMKTMVVWQHYQELYEGQKGILVDQTTGKCFDPDCSCQKNTPTQ